MNESNAGIYLLAWIASAVAGYFIGKSKGRAGLGVALGLLLGVCGLIVIALIPPTAAVKAQRNGGFGGQPMSGPLGGPPSWTPSAPMPSNLPSPSSPLPPPPPMPNVQPAAWHPDPSGRHQLRYFDGARWTEHVSDNGVQSTDPV